MGGEKATTFKEIKRKGICLKVRSEYGYLRIPTPYRSLFKSKRARLFFDPENSLLAIKPCTKENEGYNITVDRIWCTHLLRKYHIKTQEAQIRWDKKRKFLIAEIKRE